MKIEKEIIDRIKEEVKIEDIIGQYLMLKKKGKDLWALCPFHKEKKASFSVQFKKGFYKCFGCNAKGNVITFLMKHQGISFLEAIKQLASKTNINIKLN